MKSIIRNFIGGYPVSVSAGQNPAGGCSNIIADNIVHPDIVQKRVKKAHIVAEALQKSNCVQSEVLSEIFIVSQIQIMLAVYFLQHFIHCLHRFFCKLILVSHLMYRKLQGQIADFLLAEPDVKQFLENSTKKRDQIYRIKLPQK